MIENDSISNNSTDKTGDTIATSEAVANAIKSPEEIMAEYSNKIEAELNQRLPVSQARNRAERRALKYNKAKRERAEKIELLRERVRAQMYADAIKRIQNLDSKMEEKLNDSNTAEVGV